MEGESKKAAEKAMKLLLVQDRTYKELHDRLIRNGFSEKATEDALDYVTGFGYLDDTRYAAAYLEYHKEHRSGKEIRYILLKKGISKEVLQEVFQEYQIEDEQPAVRKLILKRLKGRRLSELDFNEKNRITAYLSRKGFSISGIRNQMRILEENEQ